MCVSSTVQGQIVTTRSSYALLDRYQGQWFPASATFNAPPDAATMPTVEFYDHDPGDAGGMRDPLRDALVPECVSALASLCYTGHDQHWISGYVPTRMLRDP